MRQTFSTPNARLKVARKTFADGKEGNVLVGYPIVWGQNSSDRGGYQVKLAPNSAKFTPEVMALWHHDYSRPLAGTVNGSMTIGEPDEIGIPCEIQLDMNTTAGKDCLAYVQSGLVGGCSFSMTNGFEQYSESEENGNCIIIVSQFTCDEMTITPIPAFSGTSIGVKPAVEEMEDEEVDTPARISASHQLDQLRLAMLKI